MTTIDTTPAVAPAGRRSRKVRIAGWLLTAAGLGHTLGSFLETAPDHLRTWFDGHLWSQADYTAWSDAAAGFWYSAFSFGPPLLLVGVTVLWLERRGITPPLVIAVSVATWVIVTFVASGPSPLPLLLIASGLLIAESRRTGTLAPLPGKKS
ncbi:DUF6463 family protein [Kribbella sp. CA-293567]|uniref:DUF6463 family protein n=1 Tax=Kribbella sp. CA-293567 TaxID=3002436 RepID=UPI0022DE15E4|nr:DUF6463 family protein [Kribbella sp. CA-293567]WBQ06216.1 DUF6463 family protein [Kribbella sp. CA-293567]